jgi:hypothetical protein
VIWLRGGTYTGNFVSRLKGNEGAEITVRAYGRERVILDGRSDKTPSASPLLIEGPYVVVWGLEVTSSDPGRVGAPGTDVDLRATGISVLGSHTKLINNIVHDTGNCIGHWTPGTDAEVYGNILYFCGWDGPIRGHGHALYVQNAGGIKEIRENIMFDEFAYGIHAYTETGAIDDLRFRRNVVFGASSLSRLTPNWAADILVGGSRVARRPVLEGNFTYRARGSNKLGYSVGTDGATVTGNYFIEGVDGLALSTVDPRNLTMTGNTFLGSVPDANQFPDNIFESTPPHGVWRFVLPNAYDSNRVTLVVYNWDAQDRVPVDASAFLKAGDQYELHNVQDYFGDTITSTHDGGQLMLPMRDHTVGVPIGWHAPPTTFPTFGVFVLIKTALRP